MAIVLGSGLGAVVDALEDRIDVGFGDLGLPQSTVPGHSGRAYMGRLGAHRVCIFAGRAHLYEGHEPDVVVRGVRALSRWGVQSLMLTCSAGGITPGLDPGRVAVITDHINFQFTSPLLGPRSGGPTDFVDMSDAYSPRLRAALFSAASQHGLNLLSGVYLACLGPAYETPAEIRAFRAIGADLVGMSTVLEVLAAREAGLEVAALAVVTNRAAGLADGGLDHSEVTDIAGGVAPKLAKVFEAVCNGL